MSFQYFRYVFITGIILFHLFNRPLTSNAVGGRNCSWFNVMKM